MKKMLVYCKIWDVEEKTSSKGTNYLSVCFTESFKDMEGNWKSSYEYFGVFKNSKNPDIYDNLKKMIKDGTIKTVKAAKKDATRVVLNLTPKIGKDYKTGEPKFEYTYWGIELDTEHNSTDTPKVNPYDAKRPVEEEEIDVNEDEEMPF